MGQDGGYAGINATFCPLLLGKRTGLTRKNMITEAIIKCSIFGHKYLTGGVSPSQLMSPDDSYCNLATANVTWS